MTEEAAERRIFCAKIVQMWILAPFQGVSDCLSVKRRLPEVQLHKD